MYTRHHFVLSVVVGLGLAGWYEGPGGWPLLLGWAAVVGTLVDLDHFLLARWRTGSWGALRRCLADPRVALLDQGDIFERGDVGPLSRLASHLVVGGVLSLGLVGISWQLAVATAAVLWVHLLSDAVWDARRLEWPGG